MKLNLLFLTLLLLCKPSFAADVKFTILHTSDIHGHFTNLDSPIHLGGIARLKSKIDFLRKKNQNTLLLDSGDWSEGTLFYTLNSGEANHRMMEAMGYDAIVLGNHEWLVGPKDLYEAFDAAKFNIPVVSANLNIPTNNSKFHLEKYIKPYTIKKVAGKKIGILGLSTFEMIFDPFFEPVEVTEPTKAALKYVKILREQEKCDVVILLSHLGIDADKNIAEAVPGIDMIVGGHTHILLKKPVFANGVPIVHIGQWAQYVGEYEVTIHDNGKLELTQHHVYQIDENEPEDSFIEGMVVGFQKQIEALRGKVFDDHIFMSQVNLALGHNLTEDALADWAVDAIRKAGKTDMAFDIGQYYRRAFYPGPASTVDFFNMFPHIYNKSTQKSWTVLTMDVRGQTLLQMINLMSKIQVGVRVSGASYRIDADDTLSSIKNFLLNGNPIDPNQYYKISATNGIFYAFDYLKRMGIDVGVHGVKDTKLEAWKVIKDALVAKSPLDVNKIKWEGRVRTVQPDLYVPLEQIVVKKVDAKTVTVRYKVINAGLTQVAYPSVLIKVDVTPKNTLDENWSSDAVAAPLEPTYLKAGESFEKTATFIKDSWPSGYYDISVETNIDPAEYNKDNNRAEGYFSL
jgi:2',3'-cyclic-nucleotide 2'-phosphodiesterase (5'-nucleotidase family)